MPPPKKPAKKAPPTTKQESGKDLRRAYEHLGRVQALHNVSNTQHHAVATLTKLAEQMLARSEPRNAAELLRASEHLSFGTLVSAERESSLDPQLKAAIGEEYSHKLEKAQKHLGESAAAQGELSSIFDDVLRDAKSSYAEGTYRKALELIRAAEALTHTQTATEKQLSHSTQHKQLTS